MFTEKEDREKILELVAEYCRNHHNQNKDFEPGDRIGYAGRVYDEKEMVNLVDSALDFWLTAGRYTDEFEKKLAEYLGVKYASLVNSGSSANLLAFMTLTSPLLGERRILPGDEVITVACGFPTTVTPMLQYGVEPVFCDVTIPQYNIDVAQLESALSPKTKAVMIAHTLGNPFDIRAVKAFCDKYQLWLIEDNCDALGSTVDGRFTGTIGDIGTSSFYPPHHLTMGEGGAVYTNNALLNKIIRSMRDWGRDCVCPPGCDNFCGHRFDRQYGELPTGYDHKYVYSHFGYNLKATDMQAAIGCAQLEKFPEFVEARKKNWKLLRELLADTQDRLILPEALPGSDPSWFGFMITVRSDAPDGETGESASGSVTGETASGSVTDESTSGRLTANDLITALEKANIQTRRLFAGNLTKHPCFDHLRKSGSGYRIAPGGLATTDRIMQDTFWIGVYPGMTEEKIRFMAQTIRTAIRE
ncbi:MAG: lipopolysaccharide biosynthesis protein RfbH [Lachnospiraceae bacterium]|nr:lipopolysaccharide biosynthesis protein RfbH [Lachnospiraceae bacterium]